MDETKDTIQELDSIKPILAKNAKYLRLNRKKDGLDATQDVIASYIGASRVSYGKKEMGVNSFSPEELLKLAHFYNVTVDYLMTDHSNSNEAYTNTPIKSNPVSAVEVTPTNSNNNVLVDDHDANELLRLIGSLDKDNRKELTKEILNYSRGYVAAVMKKND
ncbi:helix-turn-helix transcriptional regulator [Cytobacillus sp. IB215665]|uniref:helix-turn-helix domain-containing protein n=1 Tax=Cytobacillus sp. IB215665 TaxID=3097357 RepID=UPI002A15BF00|nr:helix-turn-helix transcriptional regulator [Cytobacillus sp. IB215665]MDX8367170.1 helix-turn-helix transcriptional regulator [Cytobacillus sp. IB215665]